MARCYVMSHPLSVNRQRQFRAVRVRFSSFCPPSFFLLSPPPSLSLMFLPGNVNFRTGQSSKSEREGWGEEKQSSHG